MEGVKAETSVHVMLCFQGKKEQKEKRGSTS
jgi:hypothetical protein